MITPVGDAECVRLTRIVIVRAVTLAAVFGVLAGLASTWVFALGAFLCLSSIILLGGVISQSWRLYRLPPGRRAEQVAVGSSTLTVAFFAFVHSFYPHSSFRAPLWHGNDVEVLLEMVMVIGLLAAVVLLGWAALTSTLGIYCPTCGSWSQSARWTPTFDADHNDVKEHLLAHDFSYLRKLRPRPRWSSGGRYFFRLEFCPCATLQLLSVNYHEGGEDAPLVELVRSMRITRPEIDTLKECLTDVPNIST